MNSSRAHLLHAAAIVVVLFLLQRLSQAGVPVFPFDDAYITLHNASVLLGNMDESYGVPALMGATSTVHAALVALLGLILPLPWALETSAWLGVLAYATGVAQLARLCGAAPLPAALFNAAALFAGHTSFQLLNGLETGLAMGAVAWGLAMAAAPGRHAALACSAICGLMPFLRPELAALAAMLLVLPTVRLVRSGEPVAARACSSNACWWRAHVQCPGCC